MEIFKWLKHAITSFAWGAGRTDGRTESDFNAMYGPNWSAEAEFRSVELVSWGQVWQNQITKINTFFISTNKILWNLTYKMQYHKH